MRSAITQQITSFTKALIRDVGELEQSPLQPFRFVEASDSLSLRIKGPLVDLRSEGEFSKGAVPGAVNIPLLNNEDRSEVGTLYKTDGQEAAVELGLSLFRSKAKHFFAKIQEISRPGTPITLYCWRGGLRSQSVAHWLERMGIQVFLLRGGYKAFRTAVLGTFDVFANSREFLVLHGRTGSGKTEFIHSLSPEVPKLDLEGIAGHRGSAFGDFNLTDAPPGSSTQQNFENRLAVAILQLPETGRVVLELENFMGPVSVPLSIRGAMKEAPVIVLARHYDDRVERLVQEYCSDWNDSLTAAFIERMEMFQNHLSAKFRDKLIECVKGRNFRYVVRALLRERYDRLYDKSIARFESKIVRRINISRRYQEAQTLIEGQCLV